MQMSSRNIGAWLLAFSCVIAIAGCRPSASTSSTTTTNESDASLDARDAAPATFDASSGNAVADDADWRDMTDAAPTSLSQGLETRLRARANEVLVALKAKDTAALAELSDPVRGVRFSPYSNVSAQSDVTLSRDEIRNAMSSSRVRNWGSHDGSGDPISVMFRGYYKQFVWSVDFTKAPKVGVDRSEGTGNELDNISEAYPHAHFVELYFPADEKSGGMNWTSLRLVFEEGKTDGGTTLWLVGIIHGEWTI
jgi:hypothetical protein